MGVGASLQLGRFILDFERGACRLRLGTGAQAHVSAQKRHTQMTPPPARQAAPMIHGIQLWLCFGRLSVRSRSGICRPVPEEWADVPSLLAALTGGSNDSLAACSCSSSRFCLAFRATVPARPAATRFGSFSVTLSTGLCTGSPVDIGACVVVSCTDWFSAILHDSITSMSKLTVLNCRQHCCQRCQEHAITVVELARSTAKCVPDKRVTLEVSNKPRLVFGRDREKQ